jgi:hypothetical protein
MKYLIAAIALMASTLCAGADTSTTIGNLHVGDKTVAEGYITLGVTQWSTRRFATILVADKYLVRDVHLIMSRDDLQKLRDSVDATIIELDKK